jgi:hypothetical protein
MPTLLFDVLSINGILLLSERKNVLAVQFPLMLPLELPTR